MVKHGYLRPERGHKITTPSGAAASRLIELHQGGSGGKLYIHSDAVELFILLGTSDAIVASDAYTSADVKGWTYRIAEGADMTVSTAGFTHASFYAASDEDIYPLEGA